MDYPKRKHPRLKNRDYSESDYYYVTICTQNKIEYLSEIVICEQSNNVGRGLAPAACRTNLTVIGQIAEKQLFALEERFPFVTIDKYVIMPNHIHTIIVLRQEAAGASPRPTLCSIIGAFKSLTTRICNQIENAPGRKIFQTSFYEHIIRNENAYNDICRYIYENPMKWYREHHTQEN